MSATEGLDVYGPRNPSSYDMSTLEYRTTWPHCQQFTYIFGSKVRATQLNGDWVDWIMVRSSTLLGDQLTGWVQAGQSVGGVATPLVTDQSCVVGMLRILSATVFGKVQY